MLTYIIYLLYFTYSTYLPAWFCPSTSGKETRPSWIPLDLGIPLMLTYIIFLLYFTYLPDWFVASTPSKEARPSWIPLDLGVPFCLHTLFTYYNLLTLLTNRLFLYQVHPVAKQGRAGSHWVSGPHFAYFHYLLGMLYLLNLPTRLVCRKYIR